MKTKILLLSMSLTFFANASNVKDGIVHNGSVEEIVAQSVLLAKFMVKTGLSEKDARSCLKSVDESVIKGICEDNSKENGTFEPAVCKCEVWKLVYLGNVNIVKKNSKVEKALLPYFNAFFS